LGRDGDPLPDKSWLHGADMIALCFTLSMLDMGWVFKGIRQMDLEHIGESGIPDHSTTVFGTRILTIN
jgi:hypothetical protein